MAILYGFTGGAQRDLPEDAEVNEENLRASGVPGGVAGGLAAAFSASDLQVGAPPGGRAPPRVRHEWG